MIGRLPIRVRLTAAFALAMTVVLVAAGLFVYVRMKSSLDEQINVNLAARADTASQVLSEPEERFTQVHSAQGTLIEGSGGPGREAVLSAAEVRRAAAKAIVVERRVAGIEGPARVLARPHEGGVVVVGQSLDDRDETLAGLMRSFAVGGPIAVLLASLLGYALAAAGMRPVEAMRRRAEGVSLAGGPEQLPLPGARDEVRRLGETLNEMLSRLHGSFERERRFVADASHELRTPVAVVKTELEGTLLRRDLTPEVRDSLAAAVEECDRLAQLCEDLLVLARSSEGQLPVRIEDVDAGQLLAGVRSQFADRAQRAGRELTVEAEAGLVLRADPLRLRQALGNLVDNALRHGEGPVVVRAQGDTLSVSDRGAGFSAEFEGRAFERFSRADASRTAGGAGLGLAIVHAIAEAHGGSAELLPGSGATVAITLSGSSKATTVA